MIIRCIRDNLKLIHIILTFIYISQSYRIVYCASSAENSIDTIPTEKESIGTEEVFNPNLQENLVKAEHGPHSTPTVSPISKKMKKKSSFTLRGQHPITITETPSKSEKFPTDTQAPFEPKNAGSSSEIPKNMEEINHAVNIAETTRDVVPIENLVPVHVPIPPPDVLERLPKTSTKEEDDEEINISKESIWNSIDLGILKKLVNSLFIFLRALFWVKIIPPNSWSSTLIDVVGKVAWLGSFAII